MSQTALSFLDHIRDLRKRLLISIVAIFLSSIITFIFYNPLLTLLIHPLANMQSAISGDQFFVNTLFEGFVTKFKFAFVGGIVFSFPVHIYNLLRFVFPGLTKPEKRLITVLLIVSTLLAGFSLYLGYVHILPISVQFLTQQGFIPKHVGVLLNFKANIFYVFNFLVMSMLLFQFPILLILALKFKLISRQLLWSSSRYVILGIFVLTAIVTPPDVVSQISLALPLILCFFVTMMMAKLLNIGKAR